MRACVAGFCLLLLACASTREVTAREFRVLRVIDGDTFVVFYDGEPTSVRIVGVDAPDRGEPGYAEAKAELEHQVLRRTVILDFPARRKRDNFARLLCRWRLLDQPR